MQLVRVHSRWLNGQRPDLETNRICGQSGDGFDSHEWSVGFCFSLLIFLPRAACYSFLIFFAKVPCMTFDLTVDVYMVLRHIYIYISMSK